jgi:hypothetical protein
MANAKKATVTNKAASSKKVTPKKAAAAVKPIKLGGVPNQGNKLGT